MAPWRVKSHGVRGLLLDLVSLAALVGCTQEGLVIENSTATLGPACNGDTWTIEAHGCVAT